MHVFEPLKSIALPNITDHPVRWAAVVFLTALAVRLVHLASYMAYPGFGFPVGGHAGYIMVALKIAGGDWMGGDSVFFDNSPGYYYILAGLFKLFGGVDFYLVRLVQVMIGSANCSLISLIAHRYFGASASVVSGLLACFYGPLIFYDAEIIAVPWVLFFSLVSLCLLLSRNRTAIRGFGAGIALGAAITVRLNLFIFFILLPFHFFLRRFKKTDSFSTLSFPAMVLLGALLLPGGIMIRNHAVTGELIFLGPSGGHNFYFGHRKNATPYFNETLMFRGAIALKYKELAEAETNKPMDFGQVSAFWFRKGLAAIAEDPFAELKLSTAKMLLFFKDQEIPTYFNYSFNRQWSIVLQYGVITFGVLLPFFCLGLGLALRRPKDHSLILLLLFSSIASVLLTFVISRLRMPAVPIIIILAGLGASEVFRWVRTRRYGHLAVGAVVAGLLVWFSFTPMVSSRFEHNYNLMGVALWRDGRLAEAEAAFERAIHLNPSYQFPYLNLIQLNRAAGNVERAEAHAQRLAQIRASMKLEAVDNMEMTRFLKPYE